MDTEETETVPHIQDLEPFNDINIDARALNTFVPEKYMKAAFAEKENKIMTHMAELLDPMFMPLRLKTAGHGDNMLRQWRAGYLNIWRTLVDHMLVAERNNLNEIMTLSKCKQFLENFNWPIDSLMSTEDTETVFFNIFEIVSATTTFVKELEYILAEDWVLGTISQVYEDLIKNHLQLFKSYAENRPKAEQVLEAKGGANIINEIIKEGLQGVKTPFSDLLDAPVIMCNRIYYSLKVLSSFTKENHPDYFCLKELQEILSTTLGICQTPSNNIQTLPLKSGYVIQQVKKIRKLRYLFLFPNILIVTGLKFTSGIFQYKVKHIVHLGNNTVNSVTDVYIGDLKARSIAQSRKILNRTKDTLTEYLMCPRERRGQLYKWKINRLIKKIFKYEFIISLLLPHVRLIVSDINSEEQYYFIFLSYFRCELWKQMLNENNYADVDLEKFLTYIDQYSQISRMPNLKFSVDDVRYYNGTLNIVVHQVHCLEEFTDSYVTLQADSFGGYFNKIHKTNTVVYSPSPAYNECFEITLCCSENMKISLYTRPTNSQDADFTLTLSGTLNFENTPISDACQFLLVPMYPSEKRIAAALTVRYISNCNGSTRKMSLLQWEALDYIKTMRGIVFGQPLDEISERERRDIPLIVESCVKFVDEHGLDVENIYLIHGDPQHVEELIVVYNLCCFTGTLAIQDKKYSAYDIGTLLINYLLSLPSPLLVNTNLYATADDPLVRQREARFILKLLKGLPEPNQTIFDYLIEHMMKLFQKRSTNKLSSCEICKVFGYTFLGLPLSTDTLNQTGENFDIFFYVLEYILKRKLNMNDMGSLHSIHSITSFN